MCLLVLGEVYTVFRLSVATATFTVCVVAQRESYRLLVPLKLNPPLVYLIFNHVVRHVSVEPLGLVKGRVRSNF